MWQNRWLHLFLIVLFALVAYSQVVLLQGILKWDALHCFLAWRYDVTEHIRAGQLPLWCPYQHLGFPLYGDPDTGAWYPIVWIMAAFRSYDFYSLHFEWVLHIVIAGFGMYSWLTSLKVERWIALLGSFCFMGCGVFVSNAQNFAFLIGLAWSPWVFEWFVKSVRTGTKRSIGLFALFYFLMLTGSYPAISFLVSYALIAGWLWMWWRNAQDHTWKDISFFKRSIWAGLMAIGASTISWLSMTEFLPYLTRTDGLAVARLLENSFMPSSYISMITPFAVSTTPPDGWGSDFSMINMYCGLLALVGLMLWLIHGGKTKKEWFFVVAFVVLMIAAMGQTFPLRLWLAKLPALGLFRHPSLFRFIAVVALITAMALALSRLKDRLELKRTALVCGGFIVSLGVVLFVVAKREEGFADSLQSIFRRPFVTDDQSVEVRIVAQGILAMVLLTLILIGLLMRRWVVVALAVSLDMIVAVQLNTKATILYALPFEESQERLATIIGSERPYYGQVVYDIHSDQDTLNVPGFIENEHIFLKQPAWDGYNSFILRTYDALEHEPGFPAMLRHPLVYGVGMWLNTSVYGNEIRSTAEVHYAGDLILQQNVLPGWKVMVDGREAELKPYEGKFCSVSLSEGNHEVVWKYDSAWPVVGLWVSGFFVVIAMAWCVKPMSRFGQQ